MNKNKTLLIISIILMVGGMVRLLADESIFRIFGMENLWSGEPFFTYIYRLLGVFVIWIGIVLFICSKDISKYRSLIKVSIFPLSLFVVVSLFTGFTTGLELKFFLVDSVFTLFLITIFYILIREK